MSSPAQSISTDVLAAKYCKGQEASIEEVQRRVARALAAVEDRPEQWEPAFLDALERGMVMAGRINSAAGTALDATWINCFVQPVGDSLFGDDDGHPGIYPALSRATETMRRGGGVGYDFSRIRPRGAYVKSTDSDASGPVSFMRLFDRNCETVESAGARRGAQMGIMRIDHPDIREFIRAKDTAGELSNFNLSIAVPDPFMEAVRADDPVELVHVRAPKGDEHDRVPNGDGVYVYDTVRARELWAEVMASTYDHGEPGVFFVDRVNFANNLSYCETIVACNPCAEQPLPAYGCCCLGSINLTKFVMGAFTEDACFNYKGFEALVGVTVRMLDNVLDGTPWPLKEQQTEAMNKRRIGLGFLGLGSMLTMLGIRYDSSQGRAVARGIAEVMRDAAYQASVELAKERGAFPLFDAEKYLDGEFTKGLPDDVRQGIAAHGIRNSHHLSIAPTGTISLAFADNASNGIEPPFSWVYDRKKRGGDGAMESFAVRDHAFRLYCELPQNAGRTDHEVLAELPDYFVSALEISATEHQRMVSEVQPFIDSSISKTVNVREDYPFSDFEGLYMEAWLRGAKSLATFRPNTVTGSIMSIPGTEGKLADLVGTDPRIVIDKVPTPALDSLRWPKRPELPDGNAGRCYRVVHPKGPKYALFVGEIQNGRTSPFEVWVQGDGAPRGLEALAKNLSYDMFGMDRGWLGRKLDVLAQCGSDEEAFALAMPPEGKTRHAPSLVAAMAMLVRYRCDELGAFETLGDTPILDALMCDKDPKVGPDGTMSWTADVRNPSTADDCVLGVKEAVITVDGVQQRRPYSLFLSGDYPRSLDGLCKSLSLDMRVVDPAWIAKKLRALLDFAEPKGEFFARAPGSEGQRNYASTVAYIAHLVVHRFAMLGILDEHGEPLKRMGVVQSPPRLEVVADNELPAGFAAGKRCTECGVEAVIRADGCDRCTQCGAVGNCG